MTTRSPGPGSRRRSHRRRRRVTVRARRLVTVSRGGGGGGGKLAVGVTSPSRRRARPAQARRAGTSPPAVRHIMVIMIVTDNAATDVTVRLTRCPPFGRATGTVTRRDPESQAAGAGLVRLSKPAGLAGSKGRVTSRRTRSLLQCLAAPSDHGTVTASGTLVPYDVIGAPMISLSHSLHL